MIQLLVTAIELKEISEILNAEPIYEGFYYYKQRPLEMYKVRDLMVAVLDFTETKGLKASIMDYKFNWPAWKSTVPDMVSYNANRGPLL